MAEEKKCSKCSMPIDAQTECKCEPDVCYHCCGCDDTCECGCKKKEEKETN